MKEIKNVEYGLEKIFEGAQDFLPLLGTDYVEFYVGNAKQAAHFYKTAFGFQSHAYAGLETGIRDRASYVLKQDKIRLVLTTALKSDSPIGEHVKKHGDGVKIVALWVEDARSAYEETMKRGVRPCQSLLLCERVGPGSPLRSARGDSEQGAFTTQWHMPHMSNTSPFHPGLARRLAGVTSAGA